MKYTCLVSSIEQLKADTVVVFATEYERLTDRILRLLDEASDGALSTLLKSEEFSGKDGETAVLYHPAGLVAPRIILAGLGGARTVDADTYRRALGRISRLKGVKKSKSLSVYFGKVKDASYYQAAVEGYLLGSYKLEEYKSSNNSSGPKELIFAIDTRQQLTKLEKAVERGTIIAEGQILVRTFSETPSNFLTPKLYADRARELARKCKVGCRVLDENAIEKEKMGALLSVAKGSDEPPRFIILEHKGGPSGQKPIVLVGKGVTFDSGGISLKPPLNMHEMKQDMTGSAVVISTVLTAARLGIKRNIVGLLPITENMPSGSATRPGDIVTSRKGKTIEIINTDAEGRLILADALDYANKYKPQAVIDIATLTGASLFILGYAGAPIMGNNKSLMNQLRSAADVTAEKVWELPIWDDHRKLMESPIADLKNSAGKTAGTIAAGAFLENFIGDWPWAHIDIAYMDLEPAGRPYIPKGGTGYGLRLLIETLSNWKKV
jgi:leucyl aminopeptidase